MVTEMEKTRIAVCIGIAVALILVTFVAGCTTASVTTPGIAGTYVNAKNPDESIEIHSDGTFYYMTSKANGYHGKWDMNGNTIRLNVETFGVTIQLEQKGNTLVESNSNGPDTVYVKQ